MSTAARVRLQLIFRSSFHSPDPEEGPSTLHAVYVQIMFIQLCVSVLLMSMDLLHVLNMKGYSNTLRCYLHTF